MTRRLLFVIAFLLAGTVAQAQIPTPVVPSGATVQVLPSAGDPLTVPAVGSLPTPISATASICNQAALPDPTLPLINPTIAEIVDPFNAGRKCRLPIPVGLPNGTGYRAVVVFTAVCDGTPCTSDRSLVGVPPFELRGIQVKPAAPTGVVVRP